MKIEKGKEYRCLETVKMSNGKLEFIEGRIYKSDSDGTLINESERNHCITDDFATGCFEFICDSYKDQINPNHYKSYSVECIDMMVAIYGKEKVAIHCELTAFKYRMRAGNKDDLKTDLEKEKWYLDKSKELRNDNTMTNL